MANNAEDFRNIIVRQTPDGGAIRIRDIAQVIDGFDTAKFSAKFNGENAAIFQVASPDNTNVSLAGKSIRKFEEEINAKLKVEKKPEVNSLIELIIRLKAESDLLKKSFKQ